MIYDCLDWRILDGGFDLPQNLLDECLRVSHDRLDLLLDEIIPFLKRSISLLDMGWECYVQVENSFFNLSLYFGFHLLHIFHHLVVPLSNELFNLSVTLPQLVFLDELLNVFTCHKLLIAVVQQLSGFI